MDQASDDEIQNVMASLEQTMSRGYDLYYSLNFQCNESTTLGGMLLSWSPEMREALDEVLSTSAGAEIKGPIQNLMNTIQKECFVRGYMAGVMRITP